MHLTVSVVRTSRARSPRSFVSRIGIGAFVCSLVVVAVGSPPPLSPAPARAAGDPVIAAAGDIACDPTAAAYNGGSGTATDCTAKATASLLGSVDAVLPLGDEQYGCGGLTAFNQAYDPTWGQQKLITHPVPGNHEYQTSGGTGCAPNAAGYFGYFGTSVGTATTGYYSYAIGAWHLVALNSELCFTAPGCAAGSAEEVWLKNDLAAHPTSCTLAYWHEPRFYSYGSGSNTALDPFWQDLYAAKADVILNGHEHFYERFAQQNPAGQPDPNGVRQFIVGTGGAGLMSLSTRLATSQASDDRTHGVLKLTLHSGSYDWNLVPQAGQTFTDSGTASCHKAGATGSDTTAPTTAISCKNAACSAGWYKTGVQVSLSAADNTGGSGVNKTYYTTDGSPPTTAGTAYTTPFTVLTTSTVKFFSTDLAGNSEAVKSQLIKVDSATPVTSIACNGGACATGWYPAPVTVSLAATDSGGSGVANTSYTTDGSDPASSATAVSYAGPFGLTSPATVRFLSMDIAGNIETARSQVIQVDPAAPTTSVACNNAPCSGSYGAPVTVSLSATDPGGSGVATTLYTTDGSDPASSTAAVAYTGSFTVASTTTVKFFSKDNTGNVEPTRAQSIQFGASSDTVPPDTSIACNGAACSAAWYRGSPVSVSLASSDTGGSGVAKTVYTTDGSEPTTSSTAITYVQPFAITTSTTVRFASTDNAGNVEASHSQQIQLDSAAPSTAALCDGSACSTGWYRTTPVTLTLVGTDTGGSGVAAIFYTTDGSDPATSSTAALYAGAFAVAATTTVRYYSRDNAGNSEPTRSQPVRIDTVAPVTAIYCNGAPCQTTAYGGLVSVSLSAGDSGGSGLTTTVYTTDGTDPTVSPSTQTYTGPFTVSQTATVQTFSTDNAGNVEPTRAQPIQVVSTGPAYASVVDGRRSLVAHWRLGETSGTTAADFTGTYNGTYLKGVTLGAPGAIRADPDTAARFNGTTGEVTTPPLSSAVSDFSIEGWSYVTSAKNANNTVYGANGTVRLMARPSGSNSPVSGYASVWLNGTEYALQPTGTASNVNTWVHWVLTRAGSTLTLYRNGTTIGQRNDLPATATANLSGTIGQQARGLYPLTGTIDEVAVYSAALSASDVSNDYNTAINGSSAPPPPAGSSYRDTVLGQSGLISYWRLGERTGTVAADTKGTANGTYLNGVALGVPGALVNDSNTAAGFNGSTATATLPAQPNVTNFSIEGWTNLSSGASNNSNGNNALYGSAGAVRLLARPGTVTAAYAGIWLGGVEYALQPTATASNLGNWVQWVLTRAGSTLSLYRDGMLIGQRTDLPATATANLTGSIGAQGGNAYFLNGGIDELSLYSTALTTTDVANHYHAAATGPAPPP
jgi:hypothetical protein